MSRIYTRMAMEAKDRAVEDAEAAQKLAEQTKDQFSDQSKQGDGMKVAINPKKIEKLINNVPKDEKVPEFKSMDVEDMESDILLADQENQHELDKSGEIKTSLEALFVVRDSVLANLRNKTCTKDSIAFARHIVNQELSKSRLILPARAMESAGTLEQQHQIVLESIGGAISRLGQVVVMNYKHVFNAALDVFKNVEQKISKYEGMIQDAERELSSKKGSFKNSTHKGSLTELWYFFATEKGQANNIVDATKHDLELSAYALGVYPKIVMAQMKSLQSIMRSASPRNVVDVSKAFTAIEKLKHPGAMFDKKFIGNFSYFNVTGLEVTTGKAATPVTFAGKAYPGIANLATPIFVRERSKASHTVKKAAVTVAKHIPGAELGTLIGQAVGGASLAYSTDDISKMIAFGKEYIENVKDMVGVNKEMQAIANGWRDSLEDFFVSEVADMGKEDGSSHNRLCFQIMLYCENLTRCFTSPLFAECARSLRGAKYIGYVTKRMIHDAS